MYLADNLVDTVLAEVQPKHLDKTFCHCEVAVNAKLVEGVVFK